MAARQKSKKFIAVVDESQMDNIKKIADELTEQGAKVKQVLSMSGIITGLAKDFDKINCVNGIKSVEEDGEKKAW